MIDWSLAVRVASRFAGSYPLEGTYHADLLARDAPGIVAEAAQMVESETRLAYVGAPEVAVVTRREWAESNVAVFSRLLAPAEAAIKKSNPLASRVVAAEMGAVLGFLARKVLGQYELVLPGDDDNGDVVYLVGANVLSMERSNQFRPHEFRLWIALHECAHRLQFVGVPWLREYFLDLVGELVASAVPEPGRWARVMNDVRRANEDGEPLIGETGLFGLFATSSQKDLLQRVQALMSLLEGHGHVVMDRIGKRELGSQQRMAAVLKQRRKDPRTATFLRMSGLEMKMRQYEQGERFVLAVEREAGWEALDRVWQGPEALPTLDEINEPGQWLRRMG
ncbi:MAG: hypothetical protein HKN80_09145 [Acidimicrobiia bacterium]|nr:hypothetical protein [Acidimicrobiia bacterium]